MTDIDIEDTRLVWPSKFTKDGKLRDVPRWKLPFQVIETVNETRATRESRSGGIQQNLFDVWSGKESKTSKAGWKNKLIWGDNAYVMSSLLQEFAGKVDLIYIDPPFNTGDDFSYDVEIGNGEVTKQPSAIEMKAYRDTWGSGTSSYLQMLYDRLILMKDLLSQTGSIYVHVDSNVGHYVKVIMDEIFGRDNFVNEIVWKRRGGALNNFKSFGAVTDFLLLYAKSDEYYFLPTRDKDSEEAKQYIAERFIYDDGDGRLYSRDPVTNPSSKATPSLIYEYKGYMPPKKGWAFSKETMEKWDKEGRLYFPPDKSQRIRRKTFLSEYEGQPIQNLWTDIYVINSQAKEFTGYKTQKPEALLERIIKTSCPENGLVADFFCGSGTTLAVAERRGMRWIGCDLSRFAIHTTRKRLLDIEGCRPFEILNLGKYERQIWQDISFSGKSGQSLVYEYLAFLLKLYDAQPISGFQFVHGRRQSALVHVGSVDAPVTISEVLDTVKEVVSARQSELHVLGWEWEMGIHDLVETESRNRGVKVRLLQIPNDVMDPQISREDVKFFDLAYIKARTIGKRKTGQVELQDFGIPSSDLIPAEVRSKIKHWSDLIDYWAVDFDFKNDTFLNTWQTYRSNGQGKLDLKSRIHEYQEHGQYKILVKVVDVFGIDSSKVLELEV